MRASPASNEAPSNSHAASEEESGSKDLLTGVTTPSTPPEISTTLTQRAQQSQPISPNSSNIYDTFFSYHHPSPSSPSAWEPWHVTFRRSQLSSDASITPPIPDQQEAKLCAEIHQKLQAVLKASPNDTEALEQILFDHQSLLWTSEGTPDRRFLHIVEDLSVQDGTPLIHQLIDAHDWQSVAMLLYWCKEELKSETISMFQKEVSNVVRSAVKAGDEMQVDWLTHLFSFSADEDLANRIDPADGWSLIQNACSTVTKPAGLLNLNRLLDKQADLLLRPKNAPAGYETPYVYLQKALSVLEPDAQHSYLRAIEVTLLDQLDAFYKAFAEEHHVGSSARSVEEWLNDRACLDNFDTDKKRHDQINAMLRRVQADIQLLQPAVIEKRPEMGEKFFPHFSRKHMILENLNGKVSVSLSEPKDESFFLMCRHYAAFTAFYGIKSSIQQLQNVAAIQKAFAFPDASLEENFPQHFNPEQFHTNVWTSASSIHITNPEDLGIAFRMLVESHSAENSTESSIRLFVETTVHALSFEIEPKSDGRYRIRFHDANHTSTFKHVVCQSIHALARFGFNDFDNGGSRRKAYFEGLNSSNLTIIKIDPFRPVFRTPQAMHNEIPVAFLTLPDPKSLSRILVTLNISGLRSVQAVLCSAIVDKVITSSGAQRMLLCAGFIGLPQILAAIYFTHLDHQTKIFKIAGNNRLSDVFPPAPSLEHCQTFLRTYSQVLKFLGGDRNQLERLVTMANYAGGIDIKSHKSVRLTVNGDDELQLVMH